MIAFCYLSLEISVISILFNYAFFVAVTICEALYRVHYFTNIFGYVYQIQKWIICLSADCDVI